MAYNLKINYADKSNYGSYRNTSKIKYIVWHYTANDGDTDESNAKYFKRKNLKSSAHYFVDDDSVTISVPNTYVAWSVGGSRYSNYKTTGGAKYYKICTNTNSISIELCDTVKDGTYNVSEKTLNNAIELTVDLMKKYNIPIENVIRHFDVTGKSCPTYYVNNTKWKAVKSRISSALDTNSDSSYSYEKFVKEIQTAVGVINNGVVDTKLLSLLPTVSKSKNNKHAVIKPLQKYLNFLGFNCGTVDGSAGSKFDSAAKAWAKANGCTADGEFTKGGKSWKTILKVNSTSSTTTTTSSNKFIYNGLNYSLVFNPTYYSNSYSDLKRHFGTDATKLFDHFCKNGMLEGRIASANFNVIAYKNRYPDLRKAFGDNLPLYYKHYIESGQKEGRNAT